MRIDLETHYSVHPLPSPPLLSKNETYFEACCFVSPPPPPPRRKEEALDEKQISIFAAIIAPLLPPPAAREMPALSLVLEFERGEEDTVVDSRRRSASEMNFIAQLGSFIGKISCASARKPPKVDIWGRDSNYSTGHYSLSFFFFLRVPWSILLPFVHGTVHWSYNCEFVVVDSRGSDSRSFFSTNERLYDPGVFKRVCTFIVVIIIISFSFPFFFGLRF